MSLTTYLGYGLCVMTVKFGIALLGAQRNAERKAKLKETWVAWGVLLGILAWPIELMHLAYVLLRASLSAAIEAV